MIAVGIDPGARQTGLAVVDGRTLLASSTIVRDDRVADLLEPDPRYLAEILGRVRDYFALVVDVDVIALELVARPRQHLNGERARGGKGGAAADPTALLATATVIGAIAGRSWTPADLVMIPPNGYGSRPVGAYPPALRGPREDPNKIGTGKLRHERSAFDVAVAGSVHARIRAARP